MNQSHNDTLPMQKNRVLIVDDEEDLTWSISKRLYNECKDIDVQCANSGNDALDLLANQPFDIVVTDLRMPGISGFQLLQTVKKRFPKMHVIVMTAFGSLEIEKTLSHWGEIDYIEKPFEMNDLRNLIFSSLRGQKEEYDRTRSHV